MTANAPTPPVRRNRLVKFEIHLELDLTDEQARDFEGVFWHYARRLEDALYSRKSEYPHNVNSIHVVPCFR